MALIKSISGIRGTIGGKPGDNLSPLDIVKFTAAYGSRVLAAGKGKKIVVGRDGRISGEMVSNLAVSTLRGLGLDEGRQLYAEQPDHRQLCTSLCETHVRCRRHLYAVGPTGDTDHA